MNIPIKRLERFHQLYKRLNGCWRWNGTRHWSGYGVFRLNNKSLRVHRIMWELVHGSIPKELFVLHKCDAKLCVNPQHLFLGTARDNLYDCIRKGRFRVASGRNHGTHTHPERIARGHRHGAFTHPERWCRGEKISWSKLREDDVKLARAIYRDRGASLRELAKQFGVQVNAIRCAIQYKTWKHVP